MAEEKRSIFTEDMWKSDLGSGVQQMDLPEKRKEQSVSIKGDILTAPGADHQQGLCIRQDQEQLRIEKTGCGADDPAEEKIQDVLRSRFYQDLCVQPMDQERFYEKYSWRDHVLLIPGKGVFGKGIEIELRTCYIFLKKGADRYTFGLDEDGKNRDIFYGIPRGVAFEIIGKGELIFVILHGADGRVAIYKLSDDVNVDIYLETDLYEGERNQYYCRMSRDLRCGFSTCDVTADPQIGESFFRYFARSVDFKDYRSRS